MRKQNGTIVEFSGRWYVSYWDKISVNGSIERKRKTHLLGPKTTRGKYPPADIEEARERFIDSLNVSRQAIRPEHVVTITDFVDTVYLPWVREQKRPSTAFGYEKLWNSTLKDHFSQRLLRDYKPHDATVFLTSLAERGWGANAVNHARALMSAIFRHAAALGYVNSNPIQLAKVLIAPKPPAETPHYTLAEMATALTILKMEPKAQTAMALSFIGLRPSEIRGLRWEDIDLDASVLHVRRSCWNGKLSEGGKRKRSVRTVTLGPLVVAILEGYKKASTSQNGYVLETSAGTTIDLGLLAWRVIRPLFKDAGLEWKSYYGGRRGAETEMNRYTNGNSQITSHHFGHTKAVADAHYIKPLPDETRIAALAFDSALAESKRRVDTPISTEVN
jgi:integrase